MRLNEPNFVGRDEYLVFINFKKMPIQKDGEILLQKSRLALKPPAMYKVLLLNDDYTPMDFVVGVLQRFFQMDQERAIQIMLEVHHTGRGLCGIFPRDIAHTRVVQVAAHAREHQYPLACVMEEN